MQFLHMHFFRLKISNMPKRNIYFLPILFIISSCSYVKKDDVDLSPYPEISVFVDGEACSTKHYLDKSIMHITFKSQKDNYLIFADSVANANKWQSLTSSENKRVYTKLIKSFPADTDTDTLSIYKQEQNIKIIWQ